MHRHIEARILDPRLGREFPFPAYATPGSAGMDLRAMLDGPVVIAPQSRELVPSGVAINIKDPGLVAIVASRSGLSLKHGVRVAQGIGVIDADYQGEIAVILANDGSAAYTVNPGDRIAQLLFQSVVQVQWEWVPEFQSASHRAGGGFGSTGTR